MRRIVLLVAAAATLATLVAAPAPAKSSGIKGEVTDNFQIKLRRNGVPLRTIKAGTYSIKIEDESSSHNFRLKGPGVNRATGVGFEGERTWRVTLRPGRYTFQCDPHRTSMKGSFRVTA